MWCTRFFGGGVLLMAPNVWMPDSWEQLPAGQVQKTLSPVEGGVGGTG